MPAQRKKRSSNRISSGSSLNAPHRKNQPPEPLPQDDAVPSVAGCPIDISKEEMTEIKDSLEKLGVSAEWMTKEELYGNAVAFKHFHGSISKGYEYCVEVEKNTPLQIFKGKPGPNDKFDLYPIPGIDLFIRAFGEGCQAHHTYFVDYVKTSTGEDVARPGNVRLVALDRRREETISKSFQDIQQMKKTTKPVPEDMYVVNEGDRMRVYVDEVAVTTFTLPFHPDPL